MHLLIYRLGSLGDTVLALPCFHLIRDYFPEAKITVLTNAPVSGKAAPLEIILASSGLIDAVIHYPVGLRSPTELLGLVRRLRSEKFDQVISLAAARGRAASLRDLIFFKACGIRRVMGIPFQPRDLVCEHRPGGTLFESEAARLLRRIEPLGSADLLDHRWVDLKLTPAEQAEAADHLAGLSGKFLAASLGTKTSLNDWGATNWTALLNEISARHPALGIVLLGSADETERSEHLLARWQGPHANLCGRTSPRISAAILERAALYIGHDSGPMHLAAAAGTRCVAIFSARCPPGQWFPVGPGHVPLYPLAFYDPARSTDLAHQQRALASITVEKVLGAVESILADSA